MDEFAQTRGVDDLFDDDVVPVASQPQPVDEPVREPEAESYPSVPPREAPAGPQSPPAQEQAQQQDAAPSHPRKRIGNSRARGRGNGFSRRLKPDNTITTTTTTTGTSDKPGEQPAAHPVLVEQQAADAEASPQVKQHDEESPAEAERENKAGDSNEDAVADGEQSKEPAAQKVPAVRGDRSRTGGLRKPKLTEEELSERMAAAKLTAAKKAAAHARAEADEASFQEREKIALAKRLEEQQNRRVMLSEREKNRQRKLNSQTGREWDAEKSLDSFSEHSRGNFAYRRGAHGSIANDGRTTALALAAGDRDNPSSLASRDRGRGRGGRGGRGQGRRGAGRGRQAGETDTEVPNPVSQPKIPAQDEFPALPGTGKQVDHGKGDKSTPTAWSRAPDSVLSPVESSGTWADQVEINEELQRSTAR
ncbi:hypothetical protein McanMca71_005408 [Microsporum canis]|uniref:Uncharacterized protein n=1 Tax=Arthroderma otae (strain ATCC MYA-4605 / CBS 113480) TaxID=554155 RepID=C5FQQ6_ARTOC|nr:conserved hypothetical protein [Microsporum canis CBS 113480]EEQ32209.1 conserved hypothetical protein [Microsporum canis CBS 113480]